ncbi:MAG: hypothetical protein ACR2FU_08390 [Streptosporangiaceae bacterium]
MTAMPAKANPRNHRNNPYMLDGFAASFHHSTAGALWRFRTEVLVLAALSGGYLALYRAASLSLITAAVVLAVIVAVLLALPWSRRFITRRWWCVVSRHRIQRTFYETRMHTRSGRLSLVLWIRPTEVGERALIWCRAGICFEDLEAHTGELAAACYAREARVEKSKRWAQLVVVHIVRRDTLAAHHVIAPSLAPTTAPQARGTKRRPNAA